MERSSSRPIFAVDPELAIKPSHLERYAPAVPLDREMRRVLAGEAVVNLVLGSALAVMKEGRFEKLGPSRWRDYCREHLGMSAPTANALIHRASAVRDRPVLLRALVEGRLKECPLSALLEDLPRDGSRDAEWVARAAGLSLPRLKVELAEAGAAGRLEPCAMPEAPEPTPLEDWLRSQAKPLPEKAVPEPLDRGPGEWWELNLGLRAYADLLSTEEFVQRVAGEEIGRTLRMEVLAAEYWSGAPLPEWKPGPLQVEDPQPPASRDPRMAPDLEVLDRAWTLLHEDEFELQISDEFLRDIPRHPHRLQEYLDELLKCRQRLDLYFGRMLRMFRDAGHHRKFDFHNIAQYAAARLGLSPSSAYEVIQRDAQLSSWGLWDYVYEGMLSLSQATLLVPMMHDDNLPAWVEFARHRPVRELQDWVQVFEQLILAAPGAWFERQGAPPAATDTLPDLRAQVQRLHEERVASEAARLDGFRSRGEMPPELVRMWAAHLVGLEREARPKWHERPPQGSDRWTFRRLPQEHRTFTLESLPPALHEWVAPLVQGEGPWPLQELPEDLARALQLQVGLLRCHRTSEVRSLGRLSPAVRTFCPEDLLPTVKVRVWVPDTLRPVLQASMQAAERESGRPLTPEECVARWLEDFQKTWEPWRRFMARARREIFERQGGRCAVPGCTCRKGLHDHHILFRSRGGSDVITNRVLLCARHHLAHVHQSWILLEGHAPEDLDWYLGRLDGVPWQVFRNTTRVEGRGMFGYPAGEGLAEAA